MVNFKQMIGLIILSTGIISLIYALRSTQGEVSVSSLLSNGTVLASLTLLISGVLLSLYMNKSQE